MRLPRIERFVPVPPGPGRGARDACRRWRAVLLVLSLGSAAAFARTPPVASARHAESSTESNAGGAAGSAAAARDVDAASGAGRVLNGDDARFLLTRTGFAPDRRAVADAIGLTRARAVDALLAAGRGLPVTPMPD